MTDPDAQWREQFPRLFGPLHVDYADIDGTFTTAPLPEDLVSRLHLVAVTDTGNIVVSESDQGWRFLPGGTREPDESLPDLACRELTEEAGAEIVGDMVMFGGFDVTSRRAEPYKPHLPHPRAVWAFAAARVRVIGAPTCPPDGEQIVAVHELPPHEAVAFLAEHDEYDADILAMAIEMGMVAASSRDSEDLSA